MKTLKPSELIQMLSTLVFNMVTSSLNYKLFKTLRLDPERWPDCDAKTILLEFEADVRAKHFDFAYYRSQDKWRDFWPLKEKLWGEMPDDLNEIQDLLDHNIKIYWVKIIGKRMISDPHDYEKLIHQLNNLQAATADDEEYEVGKFITQTIEKNEAEIKAGTAEVIIPDFPILSKAIGGFNQQRVTGFSASSGFGKTKLAINIADSARHIMPVYYFNMEMSPEDFEAQFIMKNGSITYDQYKSGNYHHAFNKILEYQNSFEKTHKITFTNGKAMNIDQICAKLMVKMPEGGLGIIDYDQKIRDSGGGKNDQEWMMILRACEKLEDVAKRTKSHIIILFQADEEGFAKSSKRSAQPLCSMIHFTKDESNNFLLKNIVKNRFGKFGFEIVVDYWPEHTKVMERNLRDGFVSEVMGNVLLKGRGKVENHADKVQRTTPSWHNKD